ncbi:hypothetical protein GCM10025883_03900 [Mobilicoccus caccae]|uniref:Uncharacterized protein n=1 Tax=Mobilicoccus caccae TaxID=1859295 RepID=A0ABQ6IKF2_9MICO|nr:hypothetical protein GCM10025883_03900 [Mobilicoccus caccae]
MEHQIAAAEIALVGALRIDPRHPQTRGEFADGRVGVQEVEPVEGKLRSRMATEAPIMPPPTTAMRSPSRGPASHRALTAVSTAPASTARSVGTSSGIGVRAPVSTTYRSTCG